MKTIQIAFLVLYLTFCQTVSSIVRIPGPGGSSGGGSTSSWDGSPIAHGFIAGNAEITTTIGPLDCTGATQYFAAVVVYSDGGGVTRTPDYVIGGTPTPFSNITGQATLALTSTVYMFWEDVTGNAAVSFRVNGYYGPLFAACWKTGPASSTFDQESASGTVTCYPCTPTLTPTVNDSLVLYVGGGDTTASTNISAAGYTMLDVVDAGGGLTIAGAFGYKVLSGGSGVAQSPVFSNSGTGVGAGTIKIANFKPL